MGVLEKEVMREAPPDRRGGTGYRVRDLCSQVLSVAEREILVRKSKGQLGGPKMHADFESFRHAVQLDAKPVDKDDRTQESDKRRGTPGTKHATQTRRRRKLKGKERRQKPGRRPLGTETRGDPNPKLGQKGHGDRSGEPNARWIDIGQGGEDDIHYRGRAMQ